MINNLVLQNGTALSKGTIFSSLRQDLVKRLLNTSELEGIEQRLLVIDEYIQVLVNSGHRYAFIKSIILQAITKYKYMVARSRLNRKNVKYQPLYRARSYNEERRKVLKYMNFALWYTNEDLGDPFRQWWKKYTSKKSWYRKKKNGHTVRDGRKITTAMFVPPSSGGKLVALLEKVEQDLLTESYWTVKLVEQAGTPLRNMFQPKFPIIEGCILGEKCRACGNDGLQCRPKEVVYSASCAECSKNVCDVDVKSEYTYIGETSRTVRLRIKEHMEALSNLTPKSFQLFHWYDKHQTSEVCPEFEFKVVKNLKDAKQGEVILQWEGNFRGSCRSTAHFSETRWWCDVFPGCRRTNGKIFQVIRGGGSSFWLPKTERTCDFVINSIFLMFQNVLICILWG